MDIRTDVTLDYMIRRKTFAGWEILPRYIRNHELVLIRRGTGVITVEEKTYTAKPGDLFYFSPGVKHSLRVEGEPYMEFYGMHFRYPPDTEPLPIPVYLHLLSPARLEGVFASLYEVYREKEYLFEWQQRLYLQQILCEIEIRRHTQCTPGTEKRVRRVLLYIDEDPCRKMTLEELVAVAGIGKTRLTEAFRQQTSTTPMQYIIRKRLEFARELLQETDLPVAEIAERSGFCDPFYFSRCFSRHYGRSPRKFREETRSMENRP